MRIVVTDSAMIWNHENPYLEQFKEAVLVVCLSGEKVTDKYECFVSPYNFDGLGGLEEGVQAAKYKALQSVAQELYFKIGNYDNILFLTDNNPESLYPFYAVKSIIDFSLLHLCACSPWAFEPTRRRKEHEELLNDLSSLKSFLYFDSTDVMSKLPSCISIQEAILRLQKLYGELLPKIVYGIHSMSYSRKYYFDFASECYIPTDDGFSQIDVTKKAEEADAIDFMSDYSHGILGVVVPHLFPIKERWAIDYVETLVPRVDGKKVCNVLREQRIALAKANHIPYESVDCPSDGPCAGTCAQCDAEVAYLTEKIMQIPEKERIYPQFDPELEVLL